MTQDSKRAVHVSELDSDIALITMDLPGTGANILNDQLFAELDQTMKELADRDNLAGVVLYSAKPNIFVAGADLNRIVETLDWSDKKIIEFCEKGRAVMARFSRCPFVSVAAIHGACVGGGLELTLWCDYRIASDDRRTKLGLPEVKLGLVPGWAGTARLPRISNFETAASLVTSGRLVDANEALEMKFIDAVVEQDQLLIAAKEKVRQAASSMSFVADRRAIMGPVANVNNVELAISMLGLQIVSNTEVYPFAPTVALEHMARTASLPIKEAWNSESLAMAQVYGSPASRGLLNHFFLVDRNKKQPGLVDLSLDPIKIDAVGIIGSGLMGRSIAETCAQKGISVTLHDAVDGLAQSVVDDLSAKGVSNVVAAQSYSDFSDVELVIESVVETIDVKKIVLQKIEAVVPESTLIASNTSAIPIEKMASFLRHPQRFCGIHFCHPELMSLVEVISGPETAEETITSSVQFIKRLRKMPVAINDSAGFVVNRLLAAMIDQSIRLFSQGVSIEAIDESMRDFGFLGGPFEIIDVIGVDTCMYAGRTMWESGLSCVSLSPVLPKMIKSGRLGRKSGTGFYHYPDPQRDRVWNDDLIELIGGYRNSNELQTSTPMPTDEITTQILSAVVLEATRILDEEIVADYRDIDLCIIHGFSFPQHQGGILFWADSVGIGTVNDTLTKIAKTESRMEPSESLRTRAKNGSKFYA